LIVQLDEGLVNATSVIGVNPQDLKTFIVRVYRRKKNTSKPKSLFRHNRQQRITHRLEVAAVDMENNKKHGFTYITG
jgi:hypothetical protein